MPFSHWPDLTIGEVIFWVVLVVGIILYLFKLYEKDEAATLL